MALNLEPKMDTSKPKILVYGHSWVRSMGRLHDSLDLSNLIVHYEGRPGATIERLTADLPNVLQEDYTHILLFTLISEMYQNENLANKKRHNKEYWVTYPNMSFNIDSLVFSLDKFGKKCEELRPNAIVHLMIPPPLDLTHYNELQLRDAPPDLMKFYQQNPKYKPFQLAHNVLQLHQQARMLGRQEYRWHKKQVFIIQNAIYDIQINCIKNAMNSYYQKEIYTMGKDSYLIDGFHPSSLLVSKIWKRLTETGRFTLKKKKLPDLLVMKVAPLTGEKTPNEQVSQPVGTEDIPIVSRESTKESNDQKPTVQPSNIPGAPASQSRQDNQDATPPNKKIKLTDNKALDEFVAAETERLIYYLYGYTTGKGLNYTTNDVATLIGKYLSDRK